MEAKIVSLGSVKCNNSYKEYKELFTINYKEKKFHHRLHKLTQIKKGAFHHKLKAEEVSPQISQMNTGYSSILNLCSFVKSVVNSFFPYNRW